MLLDIFNILDMYSPQQNFNLHPPNFHTCHDQYEILETAPSPTASNDDIYLFSLSFDDVEYEGRYGNDEQGNLDEIVEDKDEKDDNEDY